MLSNSNKLQLLIVANSFFACKFAAMGFKKVTLDQINNINKNTLMEHMGILITEIGEDFLRATMPVDVRTQQPLGLLHGGASVALIESLGSIGSSLLVDMDKEFPVGLEVNANHIGAAKSGLVEAVATIIHAGRSTHVWSVEVRTLDTQKLVCTGRLTMMVVQKKS